MALEVKRRRIEGGKNPVEIIDVIGRLDTPGAALLRNTVQDVLKEGCPHIAINLAECIEIHREMIGTFHSLGRACQRAGGGLVLYGAKGDVIEYIRRFGDRNLAPWHADEKAAVQALGGKVEIEAPSQPSADSPVVVIVGKDQIFHALFWKLPTLGGRQIVKFDDLDSCADYVIKNKIHSVIIDLSLASHDIVNFIRNIRINQELRNIGIFVVGPQSKLSIGKTIVQEGATNLVSYTFSGEEILAKLDYRTFYARLKEIYERYDAVSRARGNI